MKEQRKLMVTLTESERNERGRQVSRLVRHYRAVEEEKKETAKEFSDKLKEIRTGMDKAAAAAETGQEERMVECRVVIRGMQKDVYREDTGECIESRTLSDEELESVDANSGEEEGEAPKKARVGRKRGSDPAPTNLN